MRVDFGSRYSTARTRILGYLSDLEWHTHRELAHIGGNRYGARLGELRRLGYLIESRDIEDGHGKRYRLQALEPAARRAKRVKLLIPERDAEKLVPLAQIHGLSPAARDAIDDALASYRANRSKL